MVNKRKAGFLRKKGKPVGMSYDIEVLGNKCFFHKMVKRMKKWGFGRGF